jgi:hypothetical protein
MPTDWAGPKHIALFFQSKRDRISQSPYCGGYSREMQSGSNCRAAVARDSIVFASGFAVDMGQIEGGMSELMSAENGQMTENNLIVVQDADRRKYHAQPPLVPSPSPTR